jgi:hypothetical protein
LPPCKMILRRRALGRTLAKVQTQKNRFQDPGNGFEGELKKACRSPPFPYAGIVQIRF